MFEHVCVSFNHLLQQQICSAEIARRIVIRKESVRPKNRDKPERRDEHKKDKENGEEENNKKGRKAIKEEK